MMKRAALILLLSAAAMVSVSAAPNTRRVKMSKSALEDKIKGGWAGQTFACTYGGPTEFKYNGQMIPDSVNIPWHEGYCKWYFENEGGLYDDVYMDLTFVEVIDRYGIDVPVDSIADAFAYAKYKLWHANQAARYNIMNGIKAPQSGYWKNNPHADDLDFQIEADFAGLMCPGMPNSSSALCDKVGHIMNYGDGWYGGVYVAALYANAFIYDNTADIVNEALKVIPEESNYYKCISDVIAWCGQNTDWRATWQMVEDKWSDEISCPKGVCDPFNIDAKVNSAYVVMGLLYGNGDIERTLNVSTRCGADSDCNPATAVGILCTMLGYSNIPEKWMSNIREVEDMCFDYTDISLNSAYRMSFNHALDMIVREGGKVGDDKVIIKVQKPEAVRLEQSFEGIDLAGKFATPYKNFRKTYSYHFEGCGIVLEGKVNANKRVDRSYVAQLEINVDGRTEIVKMPIDFTTRRFDIYWNYDLREGGHDITVEWLNPIKDVNVVLDNTLVYKKKQTK